MDSTVNIEPEQDKPHDLSMKPTNHQNVTENQNQNYNTVVSQKNQNNPNASHGGTTLQTNQNQRKVKKYHIPPPLDLNAHTLEPDHVSQGGVLGGVQSHLNDSSVRVPKSPNELPRESLPLRKRHLVEAGGRNSAFHSKSPKSAGLEGPGLQFRLTTTPVDLSTSPHPVTTTHNGGRHTAPNSPLVTHAHSSLTLTPCSATSSNQAFTHFPVPPPLIPVPQGTGNAVAAVALAAMTNAYNASKAKAAAGSSGFPTPPSDMSPYAWTHSPMLNANSPFSPLPLSPFPVASLLSPNSSLSSSREDIQNTVEREIMKRRLQLLPPVSVTASGHFDAPPASPLWSFCGTPVPTPVWQCFQLGCRIRFLLPNTETPWQKAEVLALKDHEAMKIDSRNSYQYAPNGLVLVQADESTKNLIHAEDASASTASKVLLRFSPAHLSGAPDIFVEAPVTHPFLVKDKGWCSLNPNFTTNQYGVRCQDLSVGDICLPPNHPEAIRTPDLCDRFKRFEFSSAASPGPITGDDLSSPRALTGGGSAFVFGPPAHLTTHPSMAKGSPPPPSPAKLKKEKDCDKPKRPMNGFMLFAKKYRLELIQQHPGKDNRAISVLLGEAWKSLPLEERAAYSTKAKVLADEQKKINPDCWKRKKTVATSTAVTSGNTSHGENHPNLSGSLITHPAGGPKTIATTAPIYAGTHPTGMRIVAPSTLTRPLPLPPGMPRQPPPLEVVAQRMNSS